MHKTKILTLMLFTILTSNYVYAFKMYYETDFRSLINSYMVSKTQLEQAIIASKIQARLFSKATSTSSYVEALNYLDSLTTKHSGKVFDLARQLQLHWENNFQNDFMSSSQKTNISIKAGISVGIIAYGASLLYHPENTPKYFKYLRYAIPVLVSTASGIATSFALDKTYDSPPAPALIMNLGVLPTFDERSIQEEEALKELITMGISTTAFLITYKAIEYLPYLQKASTPVRLNPIGLVLSFAVGYGIEQGAHWLLNEYSLNKIKDSISSTYSKLSYNAYNGNDDEVLKDANILLESITQAYILASKEQLMANVEFKNSLMELENINSIRAVSETNSIIKNYIDSIYDNNFLNGECFDLESENKNFEVTRLAIKNDPTHLIASAIINLKLFNKTYLDSHIAYLTRILLSHENLVLLALNLEDEYVKTKKPATAVILNGPKGFF